MIDENPYESPIQDVHAKRESRIVQRSIWYYLPMKLMGVGFMFLGVLFCIISIGQFQTESTARLFYPFIIGGSLLVFFGYVFWRSSRTSAVVAMVLALLCAVLVGFIIFTDAIVEADDQSLVASKIGVTFFYGCACAFFLIAGAPLLRIWKDIRWW